MAQSFTKTNSNNGLKKLGQVNNLKTCVAELNALLEDGKEVTFNELSKVVDEAEIHYLNKPGFAQSKEGYEIAADKAFYFYFPTGMMNADGQPLIGWFERKRLSEPFKGVQWGIREALECRIKVNKMFHLGDLCFNSDAQGLAFLEDIAKSTIPEQWSYKNHQSAINYPILKSYIENTFEFLKNEEKRGAENMLVYSKSGKHLIFNTNLLDLFFHPVYIIVEVRKQKDGSRMLLNPRRMKSERELVNLGFDISVMPERPIYFKNKEDLLFEESWNIDKDFDKLGHIIEQRRSRFPASMQGDSPFQVARKLESAIDFAVAIAQRNHHYIVPMYRPQKHCIQLLMPIYMDGKYSDKPDFALVLSIDRKSKFYIPETVLPLDAAYQDARLIAKPDETWLNPKKIQQ